MNRTELREEIIRRWPLHARCQSFGEDSPCEVTCDSSALAELCGRLFLAWDFSFAGLIVEETASEWQLRYCFYGESEAGWVHVLVSAPLNAVIFPSIVKFVHAADWHEREAEDLFGLTFEGHPRLGNFVLHDDIWQENLEPMRHHFDTRTAILYHKPEADWRPQRIVEEPGAFVMPVGPKYSGVTESALFLLETVGEDVIRFAPRLFYKWRAIEKLAAGKAADQVLLLAERFAATTAFAHGLAYCQAVESICGANVPHRARLLRVFLAELERLRQHAGAIQEICESTALAVASSQAGILEEDLLRISGELTGHRYLFGMLALGGLLCNLPDESCRKAFEQVQRALTDLNELEQQLRVSSSFLDRLEEVGLVALRDATVYNLLGPVARASGLVRDLRRAQPYAGYESFQFEVPSEQEGDGYARLRVLFAEARQSVSIMGQVLAGLSSGPIREAFQLRPGAALGWVEAPRGGTFHWVRVDNGGKVARYRIVTPSFANWHGLHLSVEKFAFQDFPIILSTFDLSVAENDR
jgi:formate hydrogenlyase subunit 5